MQYIPPAHVLNGLPLDKAQLMGMPSVGSYYQSENYNDYRLQDGAVCAICGQKATNSHHLVPRSISRGYTLNTTRGRFVLLSPLFALCGSGTTGCHGLFHSKVLTVRWEWDEEDTAEKWFSGEILAKTVAGDKRLFDLGRYIVSAYGDDEMEVCLDAGPISNAC